MPADNFSVSVVADEQGETWGVFFVFGVVVVCFVVGGGLCFFPQKLAALVQNCFASPHLEPRLFLPLG